MGEAWRELAAVVTEEALAADAGSEVAEAAGRELVWTRLGRSARRAWRWRGMGALEGIKGRVGND